MGRIFERKRENDFFSAQFFKREENFSLDNLSREIGRKFFSGKFFERKGERKFFLRNFRGEKRGKNFFPGNFLRRKGIAIFFSE